MLIKNFYNLYDGLGKTRRSLRKKNWHGIFAYLFAYFFLSLFIFYSIKDTVAAVNSSVTENKTLSTDDRVEIVWDRYCEAKLYKKCLRLLKGYHKKGSKKASYLIASIYIDSKDETEQREALKWWHISADYGIAEAQYNLGIAYERGHLVSQDIDKAIKFYNDALTNNYEKAHFKLGRVYLNKKKKYKKAFHHYLYAIESENLEVKQEGHSGLAFMYINGFYVGQDFEQGLRHMELAASHGDFRAMYYAGKAYIHGCDECKITKNKSKGMHYIKIAAENKDIDAMMLYVELKHDEVSTEEEKKKIINYTLEAASKKHKEAHVIAAQFYLEGYSFIQPNKDRFIFHIKEAANLNHAKAQYFLYKAYEVGGFLEKNNKKADYWFKRAVENGSERALEDIKKKNKKVSQLGSE